MITATFKGFFGLSPFDGSLTLADSSPVVVEDELEQPAMPIAITQIASKQKPAADFKTMHDFRLRCYRN